MEHKHLNLKNTEFKFGNDGNLQFSGYASVFGGIDVVRDTIMPGAFKSTLTDRERPVALRWNHFGPVIGKFTSINEDDKGLFVEGELTKGHSVADDAAALLRHGAITGLSIGFIDRDSEPKNDGGRLLKEIELIEISVVEEPADNFARIDSVKSSLHNVESLKEIEAVMCRDLGLSRKEATVIVSSVKNVVKQSDSVDNNDDLLSFINNKF